MKIGIFDSGIGGKSFIEPIRRALPEADILYASDAQHVPYGTRSPGEITGLTEHAIQPLLACQAIVIACNTASAVALPSLRQQYPDSSFVGLEPMVKPAASSTSTNTIIVCATPATLASESYNQLKANYAEGMDVIEPDCSDWAGLIERSELSKEVIAHNITPGLEQGADTIVLACTHYHWIQDEIRSIAQGQARVIEPTAAVISQLKRVLLA